jgi:peptide/nickel transport system ATP-binding protein
MNPPSGCPFQTRCHRKIGSICETEKPPNKDMGNGHMIMCHLPDDVLKAMEPVIKVGRHDPDDTTPAVETAVKH